MNPEAIISCLSQVSTMLDQRGLSGSSLMHSIQSLMTHYQTVLQGKISLLENQMTIKITHQSGETEKLTRVTDNVAIGIRSIKDTEEKNYRSINEALYDSLRRGQLLSDALKNLAGREQTTKLSQVDFTEGMEAAQNAIRRKFEKLRADMLEKGFSDSTIQMAMRGLNFVTNLETPWKPKLMKRAKLSSSRP